jgi:RNA polymerase sigma factor (sigma-70 family)
MTHANLTTERQGTVRATSVLLLSEMQLSGPRRSGEGMQIELVERARSGDHDAFSTLVRASGPRLLGAARLILRDPDQAQDAVQEALVLAWRNVRALRDPEAWDAWLYRLTVRSCYRAAKTVNRRAVVELHVVPDREPVGDLDFATVVVERDRVGRAISRLPVDQRTVMVLHFYLDLPLTDAADILDIPVGTAKSRLHRGLEALRETVSQDSDAPSRTEERPA